MRLTPWLRDTHPGYFTVVSGIMAAHFAMALDAVLPGRHGAASFRYALQNHFWIWAVLHVLIGVMILFPLYMRPSRWRIARAGCVLSAAVLNGFAIMIGVAAATLTNPGGSKPSFLGTILLFALGAFSLAAAREPIIQPAWRR